MDIGKYLTDGLPEGKMLHQMSDAEKVKLIDTLFLILDTHEVDGYTCLPLGPGTEFSDQKSVMDDWGVGFAQNRPNGHKLQPVTT